MNEQKEFYESAYLVTEKNETGIKVDKNEVFGFKKARSSLKEHRITNKWFLNLFSDEELKYLFKNFLTHSSDGVYF